MSLKRFVINGEIEGYMSESLAEHFGLVQVDLNEFIHKFVKLIVKENLLLKNKIDQLEADNYETNKILNEYIEERSKLIDKMKGDRMEQLDDYVIYLIETYLKELGALEDE